MNHVAYGGLDGSRIACICVKQVRVRFSTDAKSLSMVGDSRKVENFICVFVCFVSSDVM